MNYRVQLPVSCNIKINKNLHDKALEYLRLSGNIFHQLMHRDIKTMLGEQKT